MLFDDENIYADPEDFPEYDEYDEVQDREFINSYTEFNDEAFWLVEADTSWEDLY